MSKFIFGRKPGMPDSGYGQQLAGQARASVHGKISQAGWVEELWLRCGKQRNTADAWVQVGMYEAAESSIPLPGARIGQGPVMRISNIMDGHWNGQDHGRKVSGIPVKPNQNYAIGHRVTGGAIAYGQDNGPYRMYYRNGVAAGANMPNPFSTTYHQIEGRISGWAVIQPNRRPNMPELESPTEGETIVETKPTIRFKVTDPDGPLGDYVKSYRVQLWNANNSTLIYNSGVIPTTPTERSTGEIEHEVEDTLNPQLFTIRVVAWDHHDLISHTRQFQFSINAGGAFTSVRLASNAGVKNGIIVTNVPTPTIEGRWTHEDGISTIDLLARLVNADTGSVVRAEVVIPRVVANGQLTTITWAQTGWASLAPGNTAYRVILRAIDDNAGLSADGMSAPFVVNGAPGAVTGRWPVGLEVIGQPPVYRMIASDATDEPESLVVDVEQRVKGETATVTIRAVRDPIDGVWRAFATEPMMTGGYTEYEWRVITTDPWGLSSTSAWFEYSYVQPIQITVTSPSPDEVIHFATPIFTWTTDRAQTHRRVQVRDKDTGRLRFDTGIGATSLQQTQMSPGLLPNNTDFTLIVWARGSDGLENETMVDFRLQYIPPPALTGVTYERLKTSIFDSARRDIPEQLPNVQVTFDRVDESQVSMYAWGGYFWTRIASDGRDLPKVWHTEDRDQTIFIDTSAAHMVPYEYYLSYGVWMNDGLDLVMSEPVLQHYSISINHAVLTSESPDDPAVTLHFYSNRDNTLSLDHDVVQGWGKKPFLFQGTQYTDTIAGTFDFYDDDSGYNLYTARDQVRALRELAAPAEGPEGESIPRLLFYRDGKQRNLPLTILELVENDLHEPKRAQVRMVLQEHG